MRAMAAQLAEKLAPLEAALGVKQYTAATLVAALEEFDQATKVFHLCKKDTAIARAELGKTDVSVNAWLTRARSILIPELGTTWNASWAPTGFPQQSTAVPNLQAERLALCEMLANYFMLRPQHEAVNQGVTTKAAGEAYERLNKARQKAAECKRAQAEAKRRWKKAELALRKRLRGSIREVNDLIERDDPRWQELGLNKPADPALPEKSPTPLLLSAGPGALQVLWERTRRMKLTQIYLRVLESGEEPHQAAEVKGLKTILKDLPSGQTVEVYLVATNKAGAAEPGLKASVVVP